MSTYATMQARIADELVRDDLAAQIKLAIQSAIQTWEGQRFWFTEGRFILLTVANQEYYDWSVMLYADDDTLLDDEESLLEVDSITVLDNGATYPLRQRTQAWFDERQVPATQYTGVPADYTVYADQLRISPIPNMDYRLTVSGLYRLPRLVNDDDTNAWMTEGEALIRNQAKLLLCQDVLRDDGALPMIERSLQMAVSALHRKTAAKAFTGRIAAWS